jgi:hypothetical protein
LSVQVEEAMGLWRPLGLPSEADDGCGGVWPVGRLPVGVEKASLSKAMGSPILAKNNSFAKSNRCGKLSVIPTNHPVKSKKMNIYRDFTRALKL